MDLAGYRSEFTASDRYLNFAGVGPMSGRARARMIDHADLVTVSTESPVPGLYEAIAECREVGGRFFGTDAEHVTFLSSTSHGLFTAAFGLRGGNVVVPANEFPANRYPWVRAAADDRFELRLVDIPDGRVTVDVLREHIDRDTRAVALSAIGYSTGYRADLPAIREACGDALLVVDSVQASGAWPVTMDDGDVVVCGSQKWMRAGVGAALVGFSDKALARVEPTLGGWTGVEDMFGPEPAPHPPLPGAARYSPGSPPFLAMGAFRGSMELTMEAGNAVIESAMVERVAVFEEALAAAGAELKNPDFDRSERSTIFTFRMPGQSTEAVANSLANHGFVAEVRDGLTRVSPHATTPLETASALREALASVN